LALTPEGGVPSVGVQLTAEPAQTTTRLLAPLPPVQLTVMVVSPTLVKDSPVAWVVGSRATVVKDSNGSSSVL